MAGSTRFDLAAGSPEGSAFPAAYPNGQRGAYSGAVLDRPGSFREGMDTRLLSSGPGSARGSGASLAMDLSPSQFLNLEQLVVGDQKYTRAGELRRVFGVSLASTSEDHSFGVSHLKPSPPVAVEELKRFKASLIETSSRSRDRLKKLTEFIGKLDKYRQFLFSRKRRTESGERLGGTGILKTGNQIHQSPSDIVTQRLDDRTKNFGLNKRIRTSLADAQTENRNTSILRPPVVMDKERDILRACSEASLPVEEKIRGLSASGEGWDKKMKRKRSVGTVAPRAIDGERELKRPMHQKPSNDPRSRVYEANGFGPGSTNGITGTNKSDGTLQVNASNGRVIPRNDLESAPFSNDKKERGTAVDKERVLPKGSKLGAREDIQVGSPSPVLKGKGSRAPRSGPSVANSSPNFSRTPGPLDGWEQPSYLNKVQSAGGSGTTNRKRPLPTGSSSPPMAQWVGQRQQKSSRTRRANLLPPVPNNDEAQISSESFPAPDFGARFTPNEVNSSLLPKGVSTNNQHPKTKFESIQSPARLSESEESGAGENKLKEKVLDNDETEDHSVNTIQKVGSVVMPTKKNRMYDKEENGDGVRRQGRSGRGSSMARSCIPHGRQKLDNPISTKPLPSSKPGSDKNESKTGRPPSKKAADRKAFGRLGNTLNSGSSDMTGESEDDHEELLAAASSVHNAQQLACAGSFWKKMEPIFTLVHAEDRSYLKQQLNFAEELDQNLSHMLDTDLLVLGELVHCEIVSSPSVVSKDKQGNILNGVSFKGTAGTLVDNSRDNALNERLSGERKSGEATPLYQIVLSALIGEDEAEEFDHGSERNHASLQYANDHLDNEDHRKDSELDPEVDTRAQKNCVFDSFSSDGSTACNGFRSSTFHNHVYSDELWVEDDRIVASEDGLPSGNFNIQSQPVHTNNGNIHSLELPYEQMSLDDRILSELHSIGLYPEAVPDLAEGEEEEVNKNIDALKEGLYQQVGKKKEQLAKVDMVIEKGREAEERNLQQIALNKLVESAYKKRMACRGSNASRNGISRVTKQAALAFVKRTIARCRKFEETGKSCFSEPGLRECILSACNTDGKRADSTDGNTISTSAQKHGPFGDKLDKESSDAYQARTRSSDQDFTRQESVSNRGKRKDMLVDEAAGTACPRASSALGGTLTGGAKGRRSDRDRDQNKSNVARNSVPKAGRQAVGACKGERKTKTKPKQKTAQLSTSGNGLLSRVMETTTPVYSPLDDSTEKANSASTNPGKEVGLLSPENSVDLLKETEKSADFNLHELDLGVSGNLGEANDLGLLNFDDDDDGLLDHDSMGLEIPMDDLSDLNIFT